MDDSQSIKDQRRKQNDLSGELAQKGWYHSFELPDGSVVPAVMSLEWQRERWEENGLYLANFRLPPGTASGWIPVGCV